MIRQPFKDKGKQIKFYIWSCFFISLVAGIICTKQATAQIALDLYYISNAEVNELSKTPVNSFWVFIVGYSGVIVFAIYSSIYAYLKLSKPGISD